MFNLGVFVAIFLVSAVGAAGSVIFAFTSSTPGGRLLSWTLFGSFATLAFMAMSVGAILERIENLHDDMRRWKGEAPKYEARAQPGDAAGEQSSS